MLKLMIPDMPKTADLLPYLEMIDESKCYVNFGDLNKALELRVSKFFDGAHVVTVANATHGLELAISALDLAPSSRILLPAFTFPATATAVVRAGHIPIFADVDPTTWQLTQAIANRIIFDNGQTCDAVLPVCAFGAAQDLVLWDAFEAKTGVPVIVDAAAAFGNQAVEINTPTVFSMHATKTLGAGEGGFIVTHDQALAERYRRMSSFGLDGPGGLSHYADSTNAKLSEYHAAVALASLDRFDKTSATRIDLSAAYHIGLDRYNILHTSQARSIADVLSTFQILLPRGVSVPQVRFALSEHGIETRRWYYPAIHQHPAFKQYAADDLPVTKDLGERLIGLPFHTGMDAETVDKVCKTLAAAIDQARRFS